MQMQKCDRHVQLFLQAAGLHLHYDCKQWPTVSDGGVRFQGRPELLRLLPCLAKQVNQAWSQLCSCCCSCSGCSTSHI